MQQIISSHETNYRKRRLAARVRAAIESFPVAVVTGARQVGKSTMLREEFGDFAYLTMDDYRVLEQARIDPQSLWQGRERVIIDEAQKYPPIFDAIKLSVDSTGRRKKFILSGSSNLLLMEKVTESLAGRALYFELLPMTYGEARGVVEPGNFLNLWQGAFPEAGEGANDADALWSMLHGFMPPLLTTERHGDVLLWLEGYVKTYLERDLRELSQVESLVDFRKVMQSLALRTGNMLNQADVARDAGVGHTTTHRYIKLLEISNIIQRVPAFGASRHRQVVKSPKVFYVDPALSIMLSGYYDKDALQKSRELGGYFESMVCLHLRALCEGMTPRAGVYYWRTVSGKEVDFVIEHGRRLLAVEVKYTDNPSARDIKGLLSFMEENPETLCGVVAHAGANVRRLHSRIVAVPWWWLDM